ncbi:hypothetical protein [Longimicrobium sp.]|uniref:hypothetical protein n=1 Tax=Longimicrobium sp. TaxID=2029185 RepID=UPI002BB4FC93|nr:hypothetical protein [Longimicrobium sp.]HSU12964.1 hypothetical protein [Longimicrobium sp.]
MNELSSVLREVLRALGVEQCAPVGLARGGVDAVPDAGDLHERVQPREFTRA